MKTTLKDIFVQSKDALISFSLWMDSNRRSTTDNDEKLVDTFLKTNPNFEEFGFNQLILFSLWMDSSRRSSTKNDEDLFDDYVKYNLTPKDETITLTKEELQQFADDYGTGIWSNTSYRICTFLGIK